MAYCIRLHCIAASWQDRAAGSYHAAAGRLLEQRQVRPKVRQWQHPHEQLAAQARTAEPAAAPAPAPQGPLAGMPRPGHPARSFGGIMPPVYSCHVCWLLHGGCHPCQALLAKMSSIQSAGRLAPALYVKGRRGTFALSLAIRLASGKASRSWLVVHNSLAVWCPDTHTLYLECPVLS